MRVLIGGLLVLITLVPSLTATKDKAMSNLSLEILKVLPSGAVTVAIGNSSDKPLRLWSESNSWGAAHWRVLLIRKGRLETFFQNPDQGFTRNIPTVSEIAPGAQIQYELDPSKDNWVGPEGQKLNFEPGDMVIVVYDVPKQYGWVGAPVTLEASKMGVWYGVATAVTTVR
jgi:hypothetical protein